MLFYQHTHKHHQQVIIENVYALPEESSWILIAPTGMQFSTITRGCKPLTTQAVKLDSPAKLAVAFAGESA